MMFKSESPVVVTINHRDNMLNNGFTVAEAIYTADEVEAIITEINAADQSNPTFRKTDELFAIRQFFKAIPGVTALVFNSKLKTFIDDLFGIGYFAVKSIYFDKPEKSNWFVAWHQDLTISVDRKVDLPGYGPWTVKLSLAKPIYRVKFAGRKKKFSDRFKPMN